MTHKNILAGAALLWCALHSFALAQTAPVLAGIFPRGGQRGVATEITLYGDQFAGATGLLFSGDPGLKGEIVPAGQPPVELVFSRGGVQPAEGDGKSLRVRVIVDAAAALGARELRVVSPGGVSAPANFLVGALPEVMESGAHGDAEHAQELKLPVTVNGSVRAPSERDFFSFAAAKGERLIFDVLAYRDGSELDGQLALYDDKGKKLAEDGDTNGLDPLIDFIAPEAGKYFLELRDLRYQGSPAHTYRLTAGSLPYLDAVFPLGARRGQEVELGLIGRNLEGAAKMKLRIAPDAPLGPQEIRASSPKGISNTAYFDVSDLPEFMEAEPNDAADKATVVAFPGAINGRVGAPKDVDHFRFKVETRRRLIFEATAQRAGSPLDIVATLADAKGTVLAQSDDAEGVDAKFAVDLDPGDYDVAVRDLLDRGGDNFIYRLTLRSPEPHFTARFFPDAPRLYRGGGAVVRAELAREAGFGGAVEFYCKDLPPGVTSERLLLKPGDAAGLIGLRAAEDAPTGPFPLHLVAVGAIQGRRVEVAANPVRPQSQDPFNPGRPDFPSRESFLTLMDGAPFTVELVTLSAEAVQGTEAQVEAVVRRRGYDGDIQVSAEGYSTGREAITRSLDVGAATLKAGETRAVVRLVARPDAEIGQRRVALVATANVGGKAVEVRSATFPMAITEIPFMLANTLTRLSLAALPPGAKSAAGEAEVTVKAARRGWFTEDIVLTLEGLPEGVNATVASIAKGAGEATIRLTAGEKAPLDKPIELRVVGASNVNGREYRQSAPPITLTVTKPSELAEGAK